MKFSVPIIAGIRFRAGLGAAAIIAAGLVGPISRTAAAPAATAPVLAPATGRKADTLGPHDSNAPVNYEADRIELQDKINRVSLSGNVVITQGDLTMHSPRALVAYTNNGSMQIQRLDATGGVLVTRGDETTRGDIATYDFNARIITMVGHVTIQRGTGDVQHSGRLVINLNTHITTTDAGPGGRVSGTFAVPKHDQNP